MRSQDAFVSRDGREAREDWSSDRTRFSKLWLRENKPYALDWTRKRYEAALRKYDDVLRALAKAQAAVKAGEPLPAPQAVGLELVLSPNSVTRG